MNTCLYWKISKYNIVTHQQLHSKMFYKTISPCNWTWPMGPPWIEPQDSLVHSNFTTARLGSSLLTNIRLRVSLYYIFYTPLRVPIYITNTHVSSYFFTCKQFLLHPRMHRQFHSESRSKVQLWLPPDCAGNKVCTPKFHTADGQLLTFPTQQKNIPKHWHPVNSMHGLCKCSWMKEMPANMHLFFCLQRSKAPGDATCTPKVVETQDSQAESSRISLVQLIFLFPVN